MAVLILLTAVLVVIVRQSAYAGRVPRRLIYAALVLPAVGLLLSVLLSSADKRTRIDVRFAGYRIPLNEVRDCSVTQDPFAGGFWLGGGARWADDKQIDRISFPGYRWHLADVCHPTNDESATLSVYKPGEQVSYVNFKGTFGPTSDIDTQRLFIDPEAGGGASRGCLRIRGQLVPMRTFTDFVQREAGRDRALRPPPTMRARVVRFFQPAAPTGDVFCVDASTPTPRRCIGGGVPLYLWRESDGLFSSRWKAVPSNGVTWCACDGKNEGDAQQKVTMPLPKVPGKGTWAAWKRAASGVTLRMLTRRTSGGVADQNVPIALDRFDVSPLRLGTPYELRLARIGTDLVVILEEPSVQLRMTDLFGPSQVQLEEGAFDILFKTPSGDEMLSVDLSSTADHLLPKTALEAVRARAIIPRDGDLFSIRVAGGSPEKHRFGDVFPLEVGQSARGLVPFLLLRRVSAPLGTYVLPLLASLLLVFVATFEQRGDPTIDGRWLLAPPMMALLVVRFALSTRMLADDYSSADALAVWVTNGALLFIGPCLLFVASTSLRGQKKRSAKRAAELYETQTQSRPQRLRSAAAQWWRGLRTRQDTPLVEWAVVAGACTIAWLAMTLHRLGATLPIAGKLAATVLVTILAGAAARVVFGGMDTASLDSGTSLLYEPRKRRWSASPLALQALIGGLLYIAGRALVTMPFGSQEQLPWGIRVDVLSLPVAAALFAAFTRPTESYRRQMSRLIALLIVFGLCFGAVAALFNDFGLVWVGGMALVLALPAACGLRMPAYGAAGILFALLFLSPIAAPRWFVGGMRYVMGRTQGIGQGAGRVVFPDDLQVARSRDYYRLLDGNQPEQVEAIPSQLAREVVIERERTLYQSLDGAWRDSFRAETAPHSVWTGAGFLQGRAVAGDATFVRAARSDYVYPMYIRAEFGSLGLLALLAMYAAVFFAAALPSVDRGRARLSLWAAALATGTAFFMIGGTSRLFPFSGKWPLLLSFASSSDAALALTLFVLMAVEHE
ncbi:MAG TPA: hypothetical protein VGQ46_20175 [Thermoanaerobaculia bacterium]|nr:hypothetical protein [Thermoanaerobaculia bacterium]